MKCWICGKDGYKKYYLFYWGGRPQIYSAQEAQTIGDVGQSIPQNYAAVDNRKANHQASIIKMEGGIRVRVPGRASMHHATE